MCKLTSTQSIASANPSISNFLIGLSHVVCLRLFLSGKEHDGKMGEWLSGGLLGGAYRLGGGGGLAEGLFIRPIGRKRRCAMYNPVGAGVAA